ncbi:MAG: gliding motility lipoprotein GldB [Flavisolibacter sp.]
MSRFLLIATVLLLVSCRNDPNRPDASGIKVNVSIDRFEQDFFALDTNRLAGGLMELNRRFPDFYPFYLQQILRIPGADTSGYPVIREIIRSYGPIYDSLEKKYRSLGWLKTELQPGFQYVKYYYPAYPLPRIITFIGTFDAPGIALTPHYLAIGLHQYAGKNFSAYRDPQLQEVYPAYITRRFDREYMATNCIKAIVDDIYPDSSAGRSLVEQMVEKGKQWFLLDKFLPGTADSLKTGFTQKQLDWVQQNEGNIWGYFTANTDIYTIDPGVIQDYIGEAPFTRGMPEGAAPGNIGQWVGWQIVKKYASLHPALRVQEVLSTPARTIFLESKYKPK